MVLEFRLLVINYKAFVKRTSVIFLQAILFSIDGKYFFSNISYKQAKRKFKLPLKKNIKECIWQINARI
jgi:hypothetical protein